MIAKRFAVSAPLFIRRKRYKLHRKLEQVFKFEEMSLAYQWIYEVTGSEHISAMSVKQLDVLFSKLDELQKFPYKVQLIRDKDELETFVKNKLRLLKFFIQNL